MTNICRVHDNKACLCGGTDEPEQAATIVYIGVDDTEIMGKSSVQSSASSRVLRMLAERLDASGEASSRIEAVIAPPGGVKIAILKPRPKPTDEK